MITISSAVFTALIAIVTFALGKLFQNGLVAHNFILGVIVLIALVLGVIALIS